MISGSVENGNQHRVTMPFYSGSAGVRDRSDFVEIAFMRPVSASMLTRKEALIAAARGTPVQEEMVVPCAVTVDGEELRAVTIRRGQFDDRMVVITAVRP